MLSPALEIPPKTSATNAPGRLHVVHLIEALGPGGAERLLYTNLKHFDPERIRSTVFTVYPQATHWREPIQKLGVPVISLNCQSVRGLPSAIKRFHAWLRANQPDLIHSHLWAANVVARVAGRLAGVPVVSSIHSPDHETQVWAHGANVSLMKRRSVRAIDRWTARFGSQRLIAVSNYVRQSTHRNLKFALEDIDLLYNPIDAELLMASSEKNRAQVLDECGLPEDAMLLLNVAHVSPQKGLIHALQALPKIVEQHPTAHLMSVGAITDPAWLDQLKSEARAAGVEDHFHVLGTQRDVTDFLRACDVFVFPSLYEGLGIALIEAMAAGCACVATTAGPIPEIAENGRDAVLVPPADPEALAAAVCDLLADDEKRARLGAAARKTALERFQPGPAADRLTEIYEKVVQRTV
jgi:glycosyltransferase involved in cell wall biosynthesis